jgi:alpha-glucosidase
MNNMKFYFVLFALCFATFSMQAKKIEIELLEGEKIWSGAIKEGHKMPLSGSYQFDFYANNMYNQLQPLLISNKGLYVWSEEPYHFEIKGNKLIVTDEYNAVQTGREGSTLAEVRKYASDTFFPASGKMPDPLLFSAPQYNTWIELTYYHNQKDILKYAQAILDNGMPPGVFMIDDTWQEDYGLWDFHPGRFPNPKAMMDSLHQMGFKVMLWICPFVSADQYLIYNELRNKKALLLHKENENATWENAKKPAMIRWWNGVSAQLDFTNPEAVDWFNAQLERLVTEYNVDGFKLDAGDMDFYPEYTLNKENATPNRQSELYVQFGLDYPLNEYRASWKMAGQPIAQRLHDKNHNWEDLQKLVPHMLTEGLVGYTFSCPDMIGGGNFVSFLDKDTYDQDLVVRSAQCHALMPMMQFSVAPWRILSQQNMEIVKETVKLRQQFTPLIMELAEKSAKDGEPIISNMEYCFPNQNLEHVNDQFMLGDKVLVAPMVEKGDSRAVALPAGKWRADDGKTYKGGKTIQIDVPLNRLPYFTKL